MDEINSTEVKHENNTNEQEPAPIENHLNEEIKLIQEENLPHNFENQSSNPNQLSNDNHDNDVQTSSANNDHDHKANLSNQNQINDDSEGAKLDEKELSKEDNTKIEKQESNKAEEEYINNDNDANRDSTVKGEVVTKTDKDEEKKAVDISTDLKEESKNIIDKDQFNSSHLGQDTSMVSQNTRKKSKMVSIIKKDGRKITLKRPLDTSLIENSDYYTENNPDEELNAEDLIQYGNIFDDDEFNEEKIQKVLDKRDADLLEKQNKSNLPHHDENEPVSKSTESPSHRKITSKSDDDEESVEFDDRFGSMI